MKAANQVLIKKAAEIQSSKIAQPIYEYMKSYALDKELSFLYKGEIRDVDIYSPYFETGLQEKANDYERMVFLMEKQRLDVPPHIRSIQAALKQQNDLRKVVSQFENWLVGHMTYLDLEGLEIETVYYAAHTGFLIKFVGLEPIKEMVEDQPHINDIKPHIPETKAESRRNPGKPIKKEASCQGYRILARKKQSQNLSSDEWKKQNVGYRWVREQLKQGRSRKEIIYEFNLRHMKEPENYSSREGKELTAAILSHWAKDD